jgi:DNA-binding NarL/FixJ family response regulator
VLLEAVSHHWLFPATAPVLKELGTSQVATWIDHLDSRRPAPPSSSPGKHRKQLASREPPASGRSLLDQLTSRECEVLELMAQDRSNEEIAAELFIAMPTVKTHVNHILRKLGQTTRVGAVLVYQQSINLHPPA